MSSDSSARYAAQVPARYSAHLHIAARIVTKTRENPKTFSFELDAEMTSIPGQFAMLWLPGVDEKPFSISGTAPLMFTISRVGPFSEMLLEREVGDTVWVRGPFGRGFSATTGRVLLVGGGYGAAPLYHLARTLGAGAPRHDAQPPVVEAALGARTAAEILFAERFQRIGVPVHPATEDGSAGARGRVTDVVAPLLATGRFDRLCACGPEGMLERLDELAREAGISAELSYEAYMRCGVGICGACEHRGRLVCMDGPVFDTPFPPQARQRLAKTPQLDDPTGS
jgi:dihydroorotate dehydrogenase electron transfer subunit